MSLDSDLCKNLFLAVYDNNITEIKKLIQEGMFFFLLPKIY